MSTTLTNLKDFPPKGYIYREPSLNWEATPELALMGLDAVARAVQIVRIQNPGAGLNPSYEACVDDIKAYTCARLKNDPRFCASLDGGVVEQTTTVRRKKTQKKCKSCGRR